jgi:hypothetical protein
MFDKTYFEQIFPQQLEEYPYSPSVIAYLLDGREYWVSSLFAAHDAFVILKVYPEDTGRPVELGPGQLAFDQLAIPYTQIASVRFTLRADRKLGFEA